VVKQGNSQFLVLTKATDIQKENEFINNLKDENIFLINDFWGGFNT
jgi:hypothetical protein